MQYNASNKGHVWFLFPHLSVYCARYAPVHLSTVLILLTVTNAHSQPRNHATTQPRTRMGPRATRHPRTAGCVLLARCDVACYKASLTGTCSGCRGGPSLQSSTVRVHLRLAAYLPLFTTTCRCLRLFITLTLRCEVNGCAQMCALFP